MSYQYSTKVQSVSETVTVSQGSPAVGTVIPLSQYTLGGDSTSTPVGGYLPAKATLVVQSAGVVPLGGGRNQPTWQYPFSVSSDQPVQVGSGNVEDE